MSLISSSIPNFVNGVSQQPYTLRLVSQGEVQENGLSTVSQGLKKRPPTKHLKKIQNTPLGNCFIHTINRDTSERYIAVVTNGDLKVYDINGVEQTVNFPDGKAYLNAASPSTSFSAVTVADYTFFVNKGVTVTNGTTTTPTRPFEALVNVKLGNYGKTYRININGSQVASYTTPDGGSPSHSNSISTDFIASQLLSQLVSVNETSQSVTYTPSNSYFLPSGFTQANLLRVEVSRPFLTSDGNEGTIVQYEPYQSQGYTWNSATGFNLNAPLPTPISLDNITYNPLIRVVRVGFTSNPYNAQRNGSTLYLQSSSDFTISTEDGFNNTAMVAIKKQLQKFSDLPANPNINGFVVEITGTGAGETATAPFDSYYVQFETSTSTSGVGVWRESAAPGILNSFNHATLPHLLVREGNGTFTFKRASFKSRIVGDNESNPFPSFVGRKIADVFFYRNRLGFLSDEAVIFSEAGEYFNFMRTTVTQLLDSDPIDVNASHTKVSILKHAVPFNKQLLLFSDQTQFLIDQNDILSPKTVGIKVVTEFPCNSKVKPVGVGKNVYFPADKGDWSSVREYFTDFNDLSNDAIDVTAHVAQYIPSDLYKMSVAVNEDIMVALSTKAPNTLYVYKYFFNGNEKLQSSWSKWTFGSDSTILNADFIGSEMYLVINRADGVYLEKIVVSLGDIDVNEPYTVHLDRKVQLASAALTFNSGFSEINLSTLGYTPNVGNYQLVVKTHPTLKAGEIYDVIWDGTKAKVKGNITGGTYSVGRTYMFKYEMSTIAVRTGTSSGGQKSDTEGRLQLRKVSFNFADTGLFDVKVTPAGRETYSYTFSGKILGTSSSTIGRFSISTGKFQVPIVSRNVGTSIVLENDSPLPCSFLSADWEGFYVKRSKAI